MPAYFLIFKFAFAAQVLAVVLYLAYAVSPKRGWSRAATLALGVSLALLAAFALLLGLRADRLLLASGFEFVLAWSLLLTALVVQVEWKHKLGLLGAFLSPLSALTLLMGFRFAKAAAVPAQGLPAGWLLLHVLLVVAAFACLTATAGVAGAYLVQSGQLKRKRLGPLSYGLPSLGELESLAARLALAGVILLSLSLAAGFVWNLQRMNGAGQGDPKVWFAVAVLLVWSMALVLRSRGSLQGRRLAYAFILLFVAVFLGYYLVNIYMGGHGFLRSGAGV